MGAYLSQPVTEKEGDEKENAQFKYGVCAMQGWRTEMEDAHVAALDIGNNCALFGVFDGHGGREVAKFVSMYLTQELLQTQGYQSGNFKEALSQAFLRMDEMLSQESVQGELQSLAGPRNNADEEEEMALLSEENLPELLRKALQAKREEQEREGILSESGDDDTYEDGTTTGETSSEHTGAAQNNKGVEWKSTADSAPKNPSLSKESIVPQRSQAVHDQPEINDSHSKESIEKAEPLSNAANSYRGPSAGCTAVVALMHGDQLLVANAGDSRCVVSENGKAVPMSFDHKPTDAAEHSRIIKAGGYVMDGRVNGSLNLSRAIGDMEYKQTSHLSAAEQAVTASPDVHQIQLGPSFEFMILACDGIWDVLSNQQAVDFVRERLLEGQSAKYVSESVCDHCLAKDTGGTGIGCDNMSIMIVIFKKFTKFDSAHQERVQAASMSGGDLYS